ncbi:MAG: peptidase M18 [Bacteroidetes bacterium]|nr:peptidase M18 [bacterium]NBP63408.1 peptidase M18 [Bacteroidota bacterium]
MMYLFTFILIFFLQFSLHAQSIWNTKRSAWQSIEPKDRENIENYIDGYASYLDKARTELSSTKEFIDLLRSEGFALYSNSTQIKKGAKLIFNNRDRALIAVIIGEQSLIKGSRLIGAHHDSPRIDIKARPLYEQDGFALLQTIYYGGIKKYQWVNIPLMLSGRIDKKDGTTVQVEIGRKPDDPIIIIPDAAPHVDSPLRKREYTGVMEGEEMDPIIGSIPDQKNSILNTVMNVLSTSYNCTEEDLVSAELHITPAIGARDIGLDRSLIGSYGQDDRSCSYVAIRALMGIEKTPDLTAFAYIVDNEETGNVNNTGAASTFLNKVYGIISEAQAGKDFSENMTRQALTAAKVISADANDGISPLFPGLSEKTNAAKLGFGPSIKRYGRSFDANSEFTAWIRNLLDKKSIPWQTASYKVETGGGGTIGGQMSKEDMEVIDIGIPLLSMHSPFEIASKIDIWNLHRLFTEFYIAQ